MLRELKSGKIQHTWHVVFCCFFELIISMTAFQLWQDSQPSVAPAFKLLVGDDSWKCAYHIITSYHIIAYHIISSLCTVQFCKRKQRREHAIPGSPGSMSYFAPRCEGWKLQAWKRRSPKTMWSMHPLCQPLVRLPPPGVKNRLKQMKHISLGKLKGILGGIRLNKGTMCEMERDNLLLIQFYYPKIRWQFPH